jgi:CRP/FNR family cyclic AMP-dependent transcriptional regulator
MRGAGDEAGAAFDTDAAAHHTAGTVRLLDHLPDLAADLDDDEAEAARRALRLPAIALSAGRCDMRVCEADPRVAGAPIGLIVIDGLLVREVSLAGRTSTSLYGPGEVLDSRPDTGSPLMTVATVSCPDEAIVAILDDRIVAAARRWPQMVTRLLAYTLHQLVRSDIRSAVGKLERVEDRLLAFFWLLAERFGRRGPDGVTIARPLTHEAIGQLIGARRSTVSLGLHALYDEGLLARLDDGSWLLAPESLQRVSGGDAREHAVDESPGNAGDDSRDDSGDADPDTDEQPLAPV